MRPLALFAVALALAACAAPRTAAARRGGRGARGVVVLAGERVPVRWTDGDSFRIEGGRFAGRPARLVGVNALETFGPVHRLGATGGAELLGLARSTAALAAGREWRCETAGEQDGYRRLLVSCPDAAEALVSAGHALVFAMDGAADPRLLGEQRAAQAARAGMWARGAPPLVPTSLHSADEPDLGRRGAYDRVVDTRTGAAVARPHARRYASCEEVCVGEGAGRACMTYVPFQRRYRERPRCLREPRASGAAAPAVAAPGPAARR
jgi:micrococcal nuclease